MYEDRVADALAPIGVQEIEGHLVNDDYPPRIDDPSVQSSDTEAEVNEHREHEQRNEYREHEQRNENENEARNDNENELYVDNLLHDGNDSTLAAPLHARPKRNLLEFFRRWGNERALTVKTLDAAEKAIGTGLSDLS